MLLLTFDDGPSEVTTPSILDTLAKHDIRAVFFIYGRNLRPGLPNVDKRLQVVRDEAAAGHAVGNHTLDHANLCKASLSATDVAAEIDGDADLIRPEVGYTPFLFRPPYGAYRCKKAQDALSARGLIPVGWTIDSEDWLYRDSARELANTEEQIREFLETPGVSFGIVLMHDTQPDTAKALPQLLDWIDKLNQTRVAKGQAPIRFADYRALLPPPPIAALTETALLWVHSRPWPPPVAPLADVI
jgi:peptidoglycan/xylan/chitin deacetylase (PgdA/CDA1 family)